jgi:hypothetical protein
VKRFKKLMKEGHKHKGDKKDKTRTIIKRDATIVTSIDTSLQIVYMRRRMKMKARKRRRVIVKARKSPKRNTLVKLILYNNGIWIKRASDNEDVATIDIEDLHQESDIFPIST